MRGGIDSLLFLRIIYVFPQIIAAKLLSETGKGHAGVALLAELISTTFRDTGS